MKLCIHPFLSAHLSVCVVGLLQVYNMFHHQSLGVRINIRVTKLVLLHSRPVSLTSLTSVTLTT